MGNAKWTWIAVGYQCGLAYAVSFVVYQFGRVIFEGGPMNAATILAAAVLAYGLFLLIRKTPAPKNDVISMHQLKEEVK